MALDDRETDGLIARTLAGERSAFRQLVIDLQDDLRLFAGAFEISPGLAEEVVQATFVSAYQNLSAYRRDGAFRAWLKAIARNHILRALREQRRFAAASADTLDQALAESGLADAERMEDLDAQTRKLRACLDRLPEALRALVHARYMQELPTGRLAQQLGRTEIWIRVTLCRARKSLRRCIEAGEGAKA
jgi:RNA polymerase sigma factor (sigma-70 family)